MLQRKSGCSREAMLSNTARIMIKHTYVLHRCLRSSSWARVALEMLTRRSTAQRFGWLLTRRRPSLLAATPLAHPCTDTSIGSAECLPCGCSGVPSTTRGSTWERCGCDFCYRYDELTYMHRLWGFGQGKSEDCGSPRGIGAIVAKDTAPPTKGDKVTSPAPEAPRKDKQT